MEPARILVIDDNSRQYGQVASSLIGEGYLTQIAETGEQALTLLRQQPFDLVLLEMMTLTLDGPHVLKLLKNDPQFNQLPVIMMSAQGDLDMAIQCIRLGAEDYLVKPLQGSLLKDRINASLERKAIRDRDYAQIQDAATLRSIGQTLHVTLNPNRVLQIAFKHAMQRLKPSMGLIGTLTNGVLTIVDSFGFGALFETEKSLPLSDMGWQSAIQAERPYLSPYQAVVKDATSLSPFASCFVVPIKCYQQSLAVMLLYHIQDNTAEAMSFVEQLADETAAALWNANLYSEAVRHVHRHQAQMNSVSREMKLASSTIKEYSSLLKLDSGNVTHDMKAQMLDAIRHNANRLFLLSTDLDTGAKKQPDQEMPTLDESGTSASDDNRTDSATRNL